MLASCEVALQADASAAICHLILDTCADIPGWHPRLAPHHAAAALLRCCAEQPRLALKVAAAFRVTTDDLSAEEQAALLDAVSALLDASATSSAGVALLLHFPGLRAFFHMEAILEDLVLSSQDPVATRLVQQLGSRDMQARAPGSTGGGSARGGASAL